ncbi:O-antigen ligase family protein [Paracoccus aerodenitrificans]|uniref:O-antigen ligase family protein n=1 Tax=Paracoccus aerodenitrificans TaxID=3017781 RepID=UPI0022F141ED|nr:O-antigen ligase family protein [Paracoccus aerodenitrificans]WBU63453.1 O-antigen ligase family protein [Paracoccus aerodenitrificans]
MRQAALPAGEFSAPGTDWGENFWHFDLFLAAITVFVAPMQYFRVSFAYITLADVFALLTVLTMMASGRLPLHPFGRGAIIWYSSVFMLAFGLLFSSVVNGELLDGALVSGQYCFSLLIMPLVILQRPRDEAVLLIKVFVASMVVIMLHGAWYMEYAPDDLRFVTRNGRLASLIERENDAGALAAMSIVFTLWLLFIREIRLWIAVPVLIPLGYGLLLTGSNTGFFLTLIGATALVVLSFRVRLILGLLVVGLVGVFVLYSWGHLFLPEIFLRRVFGALETGDVGRAGTFSDRMFLIHEALRLTRDTIFVGMGADQYRMVSAHGAPVHNTYLLLLAEGGLISLLGYFGLFVTVLFLCWPVMMNHQTRWYAVLTITITVMLALVQNGLAHLYARFWLVPWFLVIGVCISVAPDNPENQDF